MLFKDFNFKPFSPYFKFIAPAVTFSVGLMIGTIAPRFFKKPLTVEEARNRLPDILDAANVPHGDLVVPSKIVHSGRFIISQWQRVAAGSTVIVLSRDHENNLCVALGAQRGEMTHPQGYMEASLPSANLTGLDKNSSRYNKSNLEKIPVDEDLEATAVREVKEEIGIYIKREDLKLITIFSKRSHNPLVHTIAAQYYVMLPNVPELKTLDHEFANDDMNKPQWYKVSDMRFNEGRWYVGNNNLPIKQLTIPVLQEAVKRESSFQEKQNFNQLLQFTNEQYIQI